MNIQDLDSAVEAAWDRVLTGEGTAEEWSRLVSLKTAAHTAQSNADWEKLVERVREEDAANA